MNCVAVVDIPASMIMMMCDAAVEYLSFNSSFWSGEKKDHSACVDAPTNASLIFQVIYSVMSQFSLNFRMPCLTLGAIVGPFVGGKPRSASSCGSDSTPTRSVEAFLLSPSAPLPRTLLDNVSRSSRLLQQLFRLVDLRSEVRATTTIRVVQQHHLAMLFPNHLLCDSSFSAQSSSQYRDPSIHPVLKCMRTKSPKSKPPRVGSSSSQIRLCSMLCPMRCLLAIFGERRDLRDPRWRCGEFLPKVCRIACDELDVRRKRPRRHPRQQRGQWP